jgi:hypothetical protein
MVKQGAHSVGVSAQDCGAVGKVANAQVGVYLGYASRKGHAFLDTKIFVPEKWFDAAYAALRNACGLPEELHHQTKPEIALEILKNALARGELPCKWFFVEVRCTTQLWANGASSKCAAPPSFGWRNPKCGSHPGKAAADPPAAEKPRAVGAPGR